MSVNQPLAPYIVAPQAAARTVPRNRRQNVYVLHCTVMSHRTANTPRLTVVVE